MWTVSNVDHGHDPGLLVKCVWGICSSALVPQNNYITKWSSPVFFPVE